MDERAIDKSNKISKDSLVFNIYLIARNTLSTKYTEGNYSINLVDIKDTAKLVPVTGSFWMHIAK